MEKLLHVKYSNERDKRFAIVTKIVETEGKKSVKKYNCYDEGNAHISNIAVMAEKLEQLYRSSDLEINKCTVPDNCIDFEYIEGYTFEEILDVYLKNNDCNGIISSFEDFFSLIIPESLSLTDFVASQEFEKVFGQVGFDNEQKALPVSDIDMIPANVIVCGDRKVLIDYEWTFDFPIPVKFIKYRAIHYYLESGDSHKTIDSKDVLKAFDISDDEIEIFKSMESNFQKYMLGEHVPIRMMYDDITPGVWDAKGLINDIEKTKKERKLQVFYDNGLGFSAENVDEYGILSDVVSAEISILPELKSVRLDPGDYPCICQICNLKYSSGTEINDYTVNGTHVASDMILFEKDDPQIIIPDIENEKAIYVELKVHPLPIGKMADSFDGVVGCIKEMSSKFSDDNEDYNEEKYLLKIRDLNKQLDEQKKELDAMKNSRVWKLNEKLHSLKRK